jgi:hypothetical protein
MEEFATNYGTQKAPGVELYSDDGSDYQLITQQPIGAGQTVLYVPADIILSSERAYNEFGNEIQQAERVLVQIDHGTQARLPLFRLMVKILAEYDQGENSAWFPWLNSLPRVYYNGVSMTSEYNIIYNICMCIIVSSIMIYDFIFVLNSEYIFIQYTLCRRLLLLPPTLCWVANIHRKGQLRFLRSGIASGICSTSICSR